MKDCTRGYLHIILKALTIYSLIATGAIQAQTPGVELPSDELLSEYISPKALIGGDTEFGEQINFESGTLSFYTTDINLRGNSSLPVRFGRHIGYKNTIAGRFSVLIGIGNWNIDAPMITGVVNFDPPAGWPRDIRYPDLERVNGDCGGCDRNTQPWPGMYLHIPGQLPKKMHRSFRDMSHANPRDFEYVTEDYWLVTRSQNGEDITFLAKSPDGQIYEFNHVLKNPTYRGIGAIAATLATDNAGNWVRYTYGITRLGPYDADGLTEIRSNDGRAITIGYEPDENGYQRLTTATANGRTWRYQYLNDVVNSNINLKVFLPDNRYWDYQNVSFNPSGGCSSYNQGSTITSKIKHPSGTLATYKKNYIFNGRIDLDSPYSKRPLNCAEGKLNYFVPQYGNIYWGFISLGLTQKILDVPHSGTYEWKYIYEQDFGASGGYLGLSPTKKRTEIRPDNSVAEYYFNRVANWQEGQLVKTAVLPSIGATPIEEVIYSHRQSDGRTWEPLLNWPIRGSAANNKQVLTEKVIVKRGSDTYTTSYQYDSDPDQPNFDFGLPRKVTTLSSLQSSTREVDYEYLNNQDLWLIGLTQKITKDGKIFDQITYDSLGRPSVHSQFGTVVGRYYYDTSTGSQSGTLKEYRDSLGHRSLFLNYHRGIPLQITKAAGTLEEVTTTRVVDDNGWIKSFTNAAGVSTHFSHNKMGWLTSVDRVNPWQDIEISYSSLGEGLEMTETVGDLRTVTRFDGLIQPISRQQSSINNDFTNVYTQIEYDYMGRVTFESFPSNVVNSAKGIETYFDPLGRKVLSRENVWPYAESNFDYLSDGREKIIDPNGGVTLKSFHAWGSPESKLLTKIESPEGVTTQLIYNKYGFLASVQQAGNSTTGYTDKTQYYYYDDHLRLCREHVPEVGDTLFEYNDLNLIIGEAHGQATGDECSAIPPDARIHNTYDRLGNLTNTVYPANELIISRTYDNMGNLLTLSRSDGVDWSYGYNSLNLVEWERLSIDSINFDTDYHYDKMGNIDRLTYPSGKRVDSPRNALGQAKSVGHYVANIRYNPLGSIESLSYGNKVRYSHTQNERQLPENLVYRSGTGLPFINLTFEWDANANVSRILDNYDYTHNIDLDYDGLDRLVRADGEWGLGSISYDSLGNIRSMRLGDRQTLYEYDSRNRLEKVTGSVSRNFIYDSRGNVTDNGRRNFTYNTKNELLNSNGMDFDYDGHGRRVKNGLGDYFVYNLDGKLLHKRKANGTTVDYIYVEDKLVARSERHPNFKQSLFERNSDRFRIQNYWQREWYINVENGEIGASEILSGWLSAVWYFDMTYWWNDYFRIQSLWKQDEYLHIEFGPLESGPIAEHWYSAHWGINPVDVPETELKGKVFQIFNHWKPDHYLNVDGGELVASRSLMNWHSSYWILHNLDQHLNTDEKITYTHFDPLGSTIGESDEQGSFKQRFRYEPFGKLTDYNHNESEPGYTGHVYDQELGLNYMQARYYDPEIGRFYSNDPMYYLGHLSRGNLVHGFGRYTYANNNPYKYTDPDGELAHIAIGAFAGGLVSGVAYALTTDNFSAKDLAINVAGGAAVGALTAAVPGAIAAGSLNFGSKAANIAASGGNAVAVGAAGSAATQVTTTGNVDAGQALLSGAANAVGLGAGTLASKPAAAIATTKTAGNPGLPVTSLSGKTFHVGKVDATSVTSKGLQQGTQDVIGGSVSAKTNCELDSGC